MLKHEVKFEADEWLYVIGSPSARAVRNFFGYPRALVQRLACSPGCGCGQKHWRLSTTRSVDPRAAHLTVVGP